MINKDYKLTGNRKSPSASNMNVIRFYKELNIILSSQSDLPLLFQENKIILEGLEEVLVIYNWETGLFSKNRR